MGSMNLEGDPAFQALAWEDPNWGGTTDKRGGYQKNLLMRSNKPVTSKAKTQLQSLFIQLQTRALPLNTKN